MTRLRSDDLIIPQGVSFELQWPIENLDGSHIDLTDWRVRAQVRKSTVSSDVLHQWSDVLGNATVTNSRVSLIVQPADSSAWTWSRGVYDVEIFHTDGRVIRITQGTIRVNREVTK